MTNSFYERLICTMLFIYAFATLVIRFVFSTSNLPEMGGGMSINMLYGIEHLRQTGLLYINPEKAPFSIIQYTPLYYYFINFLIKIIPFELNLHQVIVLHRIICLSTNIFYSILVALTCKNLFPKVTKLNIISIALIILITTPNLNFERIDNLYLLFSVLAIRFFLGYLKKKESTSLKNSGQIIFAGLACGLALLTKQTAVWLIGLISIWLLFFEYNFKLWLKYIVSIILVFLPLILVFSNGHLLDLKLNIIDGLKNGIGIDWFIQVFIKGYFTRFSLLIVFGLYIGGWKLFEKSASLKSFLGFSILYFFFAALVFSLKYGATQNYFIEFTIVVVIGICYLLNQEPLKYNSYLAFTALYIPFLLMTCATDKYWQNIALLKSSEKDFKVCEDVASYVSKNTFNGNYIYSNFHTENSLNLMLSKIAIFPCREVAFIQTYPHGIFNFKQFGELLAQGKIQYIIDKTNHFPDKILYATPINYTAEKSFGDYTIYRFQQNK